MTTPRRNFAFTLAEILTVIVIIGIASAIVIPQVGSRDDLRAAAASRVVMADLMYAQNLSVSRQVRHFVKLDRTANPQTLGVYDTESLTTPIQHPIEKSAYLRSFAGGSSLDIPEVKLDTVTIKSGGKTGNAIGFSSLGEPLMIDASGNVLEIDSTAKITLISGKYKQSILLQPLTGEMSVTVP